MSLRTERTARLLLVFSVASVLSFAIRVPAIAVDDSPSYLEPARSWAAGHGLRGGGRPLESRLPLYPLALGLVIRLFGDAPVGFSLLNSACHIAAVLLVRDVLRRRVDGTIADFTAAAAILYPPLLTSTGLVLQESFLSLLLALFFWALWRALESGDTAWSAAAGAALGLSALAKVTSLPLAVPAAALVALARPGMGGAREWRTSRPVRVAAFVAGAALVLSPWAIRNDRVLGRLEVTNNNGGQTLLGGTVSNTITNWSAFPEYLAARQAWSESEHSVYPVLDRYLYVVAWRRIVAAPGHWLTLVVERVGRFMLPARHGLVARGLAQTGTFPPWYIFETAVNAALFAGAAWSVVVAMRRRDAALLAAPLIVFGHHVLYAVTYVSPRYGVTVGPVLIAAAVLAIARPPARAVSER